VQTVVQNVEIEGDLVVGTDFYWMDFNTNQLTRVPVTGGTPTALTEIFFGGPMAADGNTIYWYDTSYDGIEKWNPGDKQPTELRHFSTFADDEPNDDIVVSNGYVYWSGGFGCVGMYRMKTDGTEGKLLAQGFGLGGPFAIDDQYVYAAGDNGIFRMAR
jgi:hypothetical protein